MAILAVSAFAQTNVEVYKAELSVPFGEADGKLIAVGDSLVFVDDDKPEFSFAIERNNIADLSKDDEVLTIQTKRMVKDRSGEKMRFVFRIKSGKTSDLVKWLGSDSPKQIVVVGNREMPRSNSNSAMIYEAEHKHSLYGSCKGRIIVNDDRISYESLDDRDHSRQWNFVDVKKMKRKSPYKLEIQPLTGDDYTFEILGQGIDINDFKTMENKLAAAKADR